MGFGEKLKKGLSNTAKIIAKITLYDFVWKARDYPNLAQEDIDKAQLYCNLYGDYLRVLEERDFISKEFEKYKKGITEARDFSCEEKNELQEKIKKYEKQIKDKDILIDFLKDYKKQSTKRKQHLMDFTNYIIRDKCLEPLIDFLQGKPYVLVTPNHSKKGRIIDYTEAFRKELNLVDDLRDKSYLEIFGGEWEEERLQHIRDFLNTEQQEEFDGEYKKGKKIIPIHITKKPAIFMKIGLANLGKDKEVQIISCIPLLVERAGKFRFRKKHSLDERIEKSEEERELEIETKDYSAEVHNKLLGYGWEAKKILKIVNKRGIVNSYLYLKNELSKLEKQEEKKKKQEEKKKKEERRKDARIRLKEKKANPRRPKKIVRRLKKRGLDEEQLWGLVHDDNLDYAGFRNQCAVLLKQRRLSFENKEDII